MHNFQLVVPPQGLLGCKSDQLLLYRGRRPCRLYMPNLLQSPQRPCHNLQWPDVRPLCLHLFLQAMPHLATRFIDRRDTLHLQSKHACLQKADWPFTRLFLLIGRSQNVYSVPLCNLNLAAPITEQLYQEDLLCRFDRRCIGQWLALGNSVCPVTKEQLKEPVTVVSNTARRREVENWCRSNLPHALAS